MENKYKKIFGWIPEREDFGCTTEQYNNALKKAVKNKINIYDVLEEVYGISRDSMYNRSGKAIFKIDFSQGILKNNSLPQQEISDILRNFKPFNIIYVLVRDNGLETYEIKDCEGTKHICDEYDAYQRSILGECYNYFSHYLFYMEKKEEVPIGVIDIMLEILT